tara:strand:+ start:40 stop:1278 length:1239 start_codon:yes stop_codon:yes gene_type:complete
MAFSFRQSVTSLATSRITNAVSNAILGKRGGGGSSDYKFLNETSLLGPLGLKNLRYPLDVEAGPGVEGNQGHYIQFFINQQNRSTLAVGDVGVESRNQTSIAAIGNKMKAEHGEKDRSRYDRASTAADMGAIGERYLMGIPQNKYKEAGTESVAFNDLNLNNSKNTGAGQSTVYVKRAATTKLNTAISMYMPPTVKATYSQDYQNASIGQASKFAADVYSDVMAGVEPGAGVMNFLKNEFPAAAREALILQGLKGAELIPGFQGATDTLGMITGEVVADRLELAFRNINKRSFQYEFKMLPKSQEEADMVYDIVLAFKKHSAPSFKDGNRSGKTLIVPDTFEIVYMYDDNENQYLNKISECVLETVDVNYGGERYKTFQGVKGRGAPPVETSITLNFKELELITRERIEEGH